MHNTAKSLAVVATTLGLFSLAAPAHAQATRTWVSGVGDDANPCSRTAPCKTFAGAISKTFINGEIDCLDPGGYGAVTITKSITIDCTGTFGSILASGTNGIIINIAVNANDPFRTVRLRGLSINGTGASGTIGTRTGLRGVSILQASDGHHRRHRDLRLLAAGHRRHQDHRRRQAVDPELGDQGRHRLRHPRRGGRPANNVSIENVHSLNNGFGVATGTGNRVSITRSVFAGNTTAGVEGDARQPGRPGQIPTSPETTSVCRMPERCRSPIRSFPSTPRDFPERPPRSAITGSSATRAGHRSDRRCGLDRSRSAVTRTSPVHLASSMRSNNWKSPRRQFARGFCQLRCSAVPLSLTAHGAAAGFRYWILALAARLGYCDRDASEPGSA